jgi:6-phosphogluconolactonase
MPIRSLISPVISIIASFALLASVSFFALLPTIASAHTSKVDGQVYVLNNTTSTNSISIFNRYSDGALAKDTSINIGGRGTGSTLGSQDSLQLSANGQWLFAVDAGSNQVSVLRVNSEGGLALTEIASSEGIDPVSLTYSHGDLHVANNGDSTHAANIAEFWVSPFGKLVALPNLRPEHRQITHENVTLRNE